MSYTMLPHLYRRDRDEPRIKVRENNTKGREDTICARASLTVRWGKRREGRAKKLKPSLRTEELAKKPEWKKNCRPKIFLDGLGGT